MSPRRAAVLRNQGPESVATLREHLVAATEQLLEHHSLAEMTTRAIAHHAGVSDGVLYNHFADKADLLMAAMMQRYVRLVERLEAAAPRAGEGAVVANVQSYGLSLVEVESDVMLHGAALLAQPALLRRFWTEIHRSPLGIDRLRRPLAGYLVEEQQLGRVRKEANIEAAVTVVFGVCAIIALTGRLNPTADLVDLTRQLDAALATAVNGFAARGTPTRPAV